jgi:hypothetical protein
MRREAYNANQRDFKRMFDTSGIAMLQSKVIMQFYEKS